MSIKCSGVCRTAVYLLKDCEGYIIRKNISERENILSVRTEKKRLVRAWQRRRFQSGMAGDELDGLWTLCHNQVSLCKLGGTVMTSSHTGWKSFFYVLAEWQVYAGRDGYVGY